VILLLFVLLFQAVISVHTELVAVPVTVTDSHGRHVTGLSQEDFRVFEDGRPQPIAVFHRGELPVTLGVVVDRSQSMKAKEAALAAAVSALLQPSRPDDELFGVDFNDQVILTLGDQPFARNAAELTAALNAVPAQSQTALYDGVAEGLQHLDLGHAGRRVLVVVSDGGDNASRRSYKEILALARRSDAVIYAIGLLGAPPTQEEEDEGLLRRLCKDTGGIAYFPRTFDEVATMATAIAHDLREQYTLGFVPGEGPNRPAVHTIDVKVTASGRGRLQVRTRSGYISADRDPKARP